MYKVSLILVLGLVILVAVACQQVPTVTPNSVRVAAPTQVPLEATEPPIPTDTPVSAPTSIPTLAEIAPEKTFTKVGNVAMLSGEHDVEGKAVVAGLQTLIIQAFTFDGKGPPADVRLVSGRNMEEPAIVLATLEQRPFDREMLVLQVPALAMPGTVDSVAIYCPDTQETYAVAAFE